MSPPDATPSIRVLGAVYGVTPEGVNIDVPSVSQRRLLGLLAIHAPRQLRAEWLADVLGVSAGALSTTVSRLRTTIGPATLHTASPQRGHCHLMWPCISCRPATLGG